MTEDEERGALPPEEECAAEAEGSRQPVEHPIGVSDVQGLARLTLDAARMITDVVEETHAAVLGQFHGRFGAPSRLLGASTEGRTGAIPGLVYRSIRAGYDAVEAGLGIGGSLLGRATGSASSWTPERERGLAVLNGVWGHHLAASRNPLAIEMAFRHAGAPLALEPCALRAALGAPGSKLLVLVHGLCMNDLSWQQDGHDHGAELARDLGYTPVYLHYNTGLHISTNGKCLAELLEKLVEAWPAPVEELTILGHSMGGLVARSAVHYGELDKRTWRDRLRRLVCLGAPHHGSRLERAGAWADRFMDATPYSAPFKRLGATRSAGITDLRHGSVIDEDWQGAGRFEHRRDVRCLVPLPDGVECYALAATLGTEAGDAKDRLLGDGLVPVKSALGIHRDPERNLAFPPSHRWVGYEMSHLDLLRSPEVYAQLQEWLASDRPRSA
ncbi:MAG: esterase/lipase family protein [Nitrososphaerales archaeon]